MLFKLFPIHYRNPGKTPIQLFLTKDQLLISCCLRFSRKAIASCPSGSDRTYADLVCDGIKAYWSGVYELPLPEGLYRVNAQVQIITGTRRRAVPIRVRRMLFMPAHVRSPLHRMYWGLFRTGQLESIGTNWSREQPGAMILSFMDDPEQVMRIAAHEAGHLFGIGDAYAALYRFFDAAAGTESYMMHSNWAVQPEEILMMLAAHVTGHMQYFPRAFKWQRFRKGFAADIKQRLEQIEYQLAQRADRRRHHRLDHPDSMSDKADSSEHMNVQSDYNATVTGLSVVSEPPPVDNENGSFS